MESRKPDFPQISIAFLHHEGTTSEKITSKLVWYLELIFSYKNIQVFNCHVIIFDVIKFLNKYYIQNESLCYQDEHAQF